MKLFIALGLLAAASSANAVVTFTSQAFDAPRLGQQIVLNFNSTTPPAGYSITGSDFGYYTGTTPGTAAAPAGDTTQYLAVLGGGTATISFPTPLESFSIYIGSIDDYNSLTFNGPGGFTQTLTGIDLTAMPNGDQDAAMTNRTYFFNFGEDRVTSITLASSQNSFEVDNIAVSFVPEPQSWAMLIAGFGLIGAAQRRRRNVVTA